MIRLALLCGWACIVPFRLFLWVQPCLGGIFVLCLISIIKFFSYSVFRVACFRWDKQIHPLKVYRWFYPASVFTTAVPFNKHVWEPTNVVVPQQCNPFLAAQSISSVNGQLLILWVRNRNFTYDSHAPLLPLGACTIELQWPEHPTFGSVCPGSGKYVVRWFNTETAQWLSPTTAANCDASKRHWLVPIPADIVQDRISLIHLSTGDTVRCLRDRDCSGGLVGIH